MDDVCFSIEVSNRIEFDRRYSGLSIPLIVPKYWGKYPDSMKEEERLKRDADALAKANKRYGKHFVFFSSFSILHQSIVN